MYSLLEIFDDKKKGMIMSFEAISWKQTKQQFVNQHPFPSDDA